MCRLAVRAPELDVLRASAFKIKLDTGRRLIGVRAVSQPKGTMRPVMVLVCGTCAGTAVRHRLAFIFRAFKGRAEQADRRAALSRA